MRDCATRAPRGTRAERLAGILVVEDEGVVALDIQKALVDMGYDAYAVAASAEEALARSEERPPDLVLMDVRIRGDRDGVTTAGLLRERYDVPVIFLTAYADDVTVERAGRVDPYAYLIKPVQPAELKVAVQTSIRRHDEEIGLRQRARWFSTALRSIADGVVTVDPEGRVTFMNEAAERLLGCGAGKSVGRSLLEMLQFLDTAGIAMAESSLAETLRRRPTTVGEARLPGVADGPSRPVTFTMAPVIEDGLVRGVVVVIRDATDQQRRQERLELRTRLIALESMMTGVAQEAGNPLPAVLATARASLAEVEQSNSAYPADEVLREIQDLAARVSKLVSDMRILTRPA